MEKYDRLRKLWAGVWRSSQRIYETGVARQWFGLVDLLFPDCCSGCDRPLVSGESLICVKCRYEIPRTDFHRQVLHEGTQLVAGQFPLGFVLSYLYFDDDSRVQHMLHQLKYLNRPALAYALGVEYGNILKEFEHGCLQADAIVPVPMGSAKLRKRGYNQSEVFAQGLGTAMGLPVWPHALGRRSRSQTQVGKGRAARFLNLSSAFFPKASDMLVGSHVLLADDVLTSGATVVACANALMEVGVDRVSVVTIARKR